MSDESFDLPELPDEIEPGEFELVFMYDESTPWETHFTWDGGTTATWWQDIWDKTPGLGPASSSPSFGWASWLNGKDVVIAYEWPDLDVNGWAHIPGGAPASGKEDADEAMSEPETWVEFAKNIGAATGGDNSLPGVTGQTY